MKQAALFCEPEATAEPDVSPAVPSATMQRIDAARLRDHEAAMRQPRPGFEAALVRLLGGMADYAEAHSKAYDTTPITQDYYIGAAWERLGDALHDLLSGETGRLDGGAMSAAIYRLVQGEGKPDAIAATRAETAPTKPDAVDQIIGIGRAALTDRQRELLAHIEVRGNVAVYTSNDRIPDWELLKRVMVALGGTWKTGGRSKPGGFRFPDDLDAAELVRLAKETGEITDPKAAEFFPTPRALAELLVVRADLDFHSRVLEPSAGLGAIALAARERQPGAHIVCVEALETNASKLRGVGFNVETVDFLSLSPTALGAFSHVLMNPPFSKRQDIQHVRHAYKFLAPGGVLVAIMSSGVKHREDKLAKEFRTFVAENQGEIWDCPEGSFLESGTAVRTVMVRLRRAN